MDDDDDEVQGLVEIPYDQEECDWFLACLHHVVSVCQQQGQVLGPEYEQAYRAGIAEVIMTMRLAPSDVGSMRGTRTTGAAIRRAADQPRSGAFRPTFRAEP